MTHTLGDYYIEALIFKIAGARFLNVSEEEINKMAEKKSCSDNHLSNYTKTIILLSLSEDCQL